MPVISKNTAQILYADEIKGQKLDDFLSKGWYRMGPTIYSVHFIYFDRKFLSPIWLRTPLDNYKYSKSLRKLIRKNSMNLTHTVQAFEYSEDLEELFQKYRHNFKGDISNSLDDYMMESLDLDIYDTWLVKVYSKNELIACSIIDIGQNSLASIFGFYDPKYQPMSLGLYTMLLEIEFAKQRGISFYYIGYFIPGTPRFDYKLRIGNIEYLDFKTREWLSFDTFDYEQIPIKVIRRKLETLKSELDRNYDSKIYQNAFIDVHIIEVFPMNYLEAPIILIIEGLSSMESEADKIICAYDLRIGSYKLYHCQILNSIFSRYNTDWVKSHDEDTFTRQLVIRKTIKTCKTTKPLKRWLETQ